MLAVSAAGPLLTLNSGVAMPALGLGVGSVDGSAGRAVGAVDAALRAGYRLVDTASVYGNEAEVADGLARSGVARDDVFLTTKLWVDDYGRDSTLRAFEASLHKLRTDYVDLYLLHQPLAAEFDATVASYQAMQKLLADGRVKAIGVCNFSVEHLARLAAGTDVVPAVNQVELHPYFSQPFLQQAHRDVGILTQAWSPIGGVLSWNPGARDRPSPLDDANVTRIAQAHDKTPAQVLLRWHLDSGRSAIPKSWRPERIRQNIDVLDFELTDDEVATINGLNTGRRAGREPDSVQRTNPGGSVMTTAVDPRVAVVTGASSGIGEATARALASSGHRVALLARRLDRITALADELGNGSIAVQADVTDRDGLVEAAERVRTELGTADVLVNNAGVMLLGPFDADQRADYRQMVEVNLLGAISTTEVFLDQLKDGGGDIVNISSVAGRTARAGNGVYAATKWGMNGWSEALRQELLPDVRVTLIEPGVVATELPNHITHADTAQGVQKLYDQAEVTAEDVAEIIAFVLDRPRRLAINEVLFRPAGQT